MNRSTQGPAGLDGLAIVHDLLHQVQRLVAIKLESVHEQLMVERQIQAHVGCGLRLQARVGFADIPKARLAACLVGLGGEVVGRSSPSDGLRVRNNARLHALVPEVGGHVVFRASARRAAPRTVKGAVVLRHVLLATWLADVHGLQAEGGASLRVGRPYLRPRLMGHPSIHVLGVSSLHEARMLSALRSFINDLCTAGHEPVPKVAVHIYAVL
mmetsp:Transcript_20133/g.56060  ORF Transcript_20133/g.56060 Transcript_20133/m.56060 type:complete len:213 (-) Transcript_20133:824-1462(-)